MIKAVLISSLLFLFHAHRVFSQDTASVFFKNKSIILFNRYDSVQWIPNGSKSSDTIIFIGLGKFFYLKRSDQDNLPIECGQLGLYSVSNRLYLLREGMWIIEDKKEKIFFGNSAYDIFVDEFQVDITPVVLDTYKNSKSSNGKRLRRPGTTNSKER